MKTLSTAMAAALLTTGLARAGDDRSQWARVYPGPGEARLQQSQERDALDDYGGFRWGQLEPAKIEALRRSGQRVVVESDAFELRLGGRSFDPLESLPEPAQTTRSGDGAGFHVIQFRGPVRPGWLRSLRARGVQIVQPLHPFSYIVWSESASMHAARSDPQVRWSGAMRAEWKRPPGQERTPAGPLPTAVMTSAHADMKQLGTALGEFGTIHDTSSLGRHLRIVHMKSDSADYASIAAIPAVLSVQHVPAEAGPRGEMSAQSIAAWIDESSGEIEPGYPDWLEATGFDGSGVVIGVVDDPILTSHQDLAGRFAPCRGENGSCSVSGSDPHGTHVAGAIAGTAATESRLEGFLRGQGVAPSASIVSQVYGPFTDFLADGAMVPDGMLQIFQDAARSGAWLTNNSWGPTGSPQGYDIPTRQVDMIARDADPDTPGNQPVLPVWSIMNGRGDGSGECAPSSLGSPDEAKNLFAVGSTWLRDSGGRQRSDLLDISANSGHGPACDGRRVPHIVAPGCYTDNPVDSGDTAHSAGFCGTSMASPVVTGAIAVWAQQFIESAGSPPSPALVKAVFTAAARDLAGGENADGATMGHRPDRFQGFGRLNLGTVMHPGTAVLLHDQAYVFDETGQNWPLEFHPHDPDQPVRIMLSWTDAPGHGLGGDTPAWVNNLDLGIETAGSSYLGNVIGADGWSASGGTADERNNLEGVFLSPEQTGEVVTVDVAAIDIAGDALDPYDPGDPRQDFGVACFNCEGYTISTTPSLIKACVPNRDTLDIPVQIELGATGDYSGPVSLETGGLPMGITATQAGNVSVPGSASWTVTVTESAAPGHWYIAINGDDGTLRNAGQLALNLEAIPDSGPTLNSPASETLGVPLRPTFDWETAPDIETFRLQLATDDTFEEVIFEQRLTESNITPSITLDFATRYHWRVQAINDCGAGQWSEARSFSTRMFTDRFEASSEAE